jgi:hypothetical protein
VVPRRHEDPKTFDPGRVGLTMRARKHGDERFPFLRTHAVRRGALALVIAALLLLAGLAVLVFR